MEIVLFLLILALARHSLSLRSRVEALTARVLALEYPVAVPAVKEMPAAVPPPLPRIVEQPAAVVSEPLPPRWIAPPPVVERESERRPSLTDRIRAMVGDQEWESLIGGSILNKIGALLLVIGIALSLGYSFGHVSAAGRAGMALAVSAGVLGAGVWAERREGYRFFARGLIGAGWAVLYTTAYAIYAVPAAQIIGSPFVGSVMLLAVGAGMIGHSLRYRSQAVTGVAYFSAFAALAVTPSSPFAVVGLIPLAVSILYLAGRFDWFPMAVFGMIATYATCISRRSSNAPLAEVQALFLAYWILFDLFDLLRVKRRIVTGGVEWIYYGNLAGFTALSYLAWAHHSPTHLWIASAAGAALFLADSIARALLRPPSSFGATDGVGERLEAGSFEVSALVSAVLAGMALVANVSGVWLSAGLALEAEAIYLLGVRFASTFLRYLGIAGFALSLARLASVSPGKTWTPPAVFHAVLFYVNRVIRRPNVLMSSAAALLVALVVGREAPVAWVGCEWMVFAVILFEIGLRRNALDFLGQAYLLASVGAVACIGRGGVAGLAIGTALIFACAVRTRWIDIEERNELAIASSGIAMALGFALLWRAVPGDYVGLCWFGFVAVALELANRRLPEELKWFIAPSGALALAGLMATHSGDFAQNPAAAVWISFFGAGAVAALAALRAENRDVLRQAFVAAASALTMAGVWLVFPAPYVTIVWAAIALGVLELRFRAVAACAFAPIYLRMLDADLWHTPLVSMPVAICAIYWLWFRIRETRPLAPFVFWMAPIPLLGLLLRTAGQSNAAPGFMTVSLILLVAGIRFGLRDARIQSYIAAGMAFALALGPHGIPVAAATVALLYVAQAVAKKSAESRAAACFSISGTLLLSALLFEKISGGMLTVAWGFEGLALLGCGFGLRERVLRLQGLSLLLACILKLFLYDLRNLETLPRILSFVALGAILLGVSWVYTRFRNHVAKLL